MAQQKESALNLTDEDVLREFVKRFQCDAAILIYLDSDQESGFAKWQNPIGRKWAKNIFKLIKQEEMESKFNNAKILA